MRTLARRIASVSEGKCKIGPNFFAAVIDDRNSFTELGRQRQRQLSNLPSSVHYLCIRYICSWNVAEDIIHLLGHDGLDSAPNSQCDASV